MQKICPACREVNPNEALFCRSCATPLSPAQNPFQQQAPPQWGQQQAQWNQPMGGPLYAPQQPAGAQSNRPIIALCLVIAGFLCCGPFTTIPGAILGWMEMSAIKEGRAPESGMVMSQIAFYGGIVLSILSLIGLVVGILMAIAGNL
jgi:hypothetical protein